MKVDEKERFIAFNKVVKIIRSCETEEQLKVANNCITIFVKRFVDCSSYDNGYGVYDIWYQGLEKYKKEQEKEIEEKVNNV